MGDDEPTVIEVGQMELVQKRLADLKEKISNKKRNIIRRPTNKIVDIDFKPYMYYSNRLIEDDQYEAHFIAISNNLKNFEKILRILYTDQQDNEDMLETLGDQIQALNEKFDSLSPEQIAEGLTSFLDKLIEDKLEVIKDRLDGFEGSLKGATESLTGATRALREEKAEVEAIAAEVDSKLKDAAQSTDIRLKAFEQKLNAKNAELASLTSDLDALNTILGDTQKGQTLSYIITQKINEGLKAVTAEQTRAAAEQAADIANAKKDIKQAVAKAATSSAADIKVEAAAVSVLANTANVAYQAAAAEVADLKASFEKIYDRNDEIDTKLESIGEFGKKLEALEARVEDGAGAGPFLADELVAAPPLDEDAIQGIVVGAITSAAVDPAIQARLTDLLGQGEFITQITAAVKAGMTKCPQPCIDYIDDQVGKLQGQIGELNTKYEGYADQIADLGTRVDSLKGELQGIALDEIEKYLKEAPITWDLKSPEIKSSYFDKINQIRENMNILLNEVKSNKLNVQVSALNTRIKDGEIVLKDLSDNFVRIQENVETGTSAFNYYVLNNGERLGQIDLNTDLKIENFKAEINEQLGLLTTENMTRIQQLIELLPQLESATPEGLQAKQAELERLLGESQASLERLNMIRDEIDLKMTNFDQFLEAKKGEAETKITALLEEKNAEFQAAIASAIENFHALLAKENLAVSGLSVEAQQNIRDLLKKLTAFETSFEQKIATISQLEEKLAQTTPEMNKVIAAANAARAAADEQTVALQAQAEALQAQKAALQEQKAALQEQIATEAEANAASLAEERAQIQLQVEEANARREAAEAELAAAQAQLAAANPELGTMTILLNQMRSEGKNLSRLQVELSRLQQSIDAKKGQAISASEKLTGLLNSTNTAALRLERANQNYGKQQKDIAASLIASRDEIDKNMDAFRDQLGKNMGQFGTDLTGQIDTSVAALQRAIEGQRNESLTAHQLEIDRQRTASLEDLEAKKGEDETKITALLAEKTAEFQTAIENFHALLAKENLAVSGLSAQAQENIRDLLGKLTAFDAPLEEKIATISQLEEKIAQTTPEMEGVIAAANAARAAADEQTAALQEQKAALQEQRDTEAEANAASLAEEKAQIQLQVDEANTRRQAAEAELAEAQAQLAAANPELGSMTILLNQMRSEGEKLRSLQQSIDNKKGQATSVSKRLTGLLESTDNAAVRLERANQNYGKQQQDIDVSLKEYRAQINQNMDAFKAQLGETMGEFETASAEAHQKAINGQRDASLAEFRTRLRNLNSAETESIRNTVREQIDRAKTAIRESTDGQIERANDDIQQQAQQAVAQQVEQGQQMIDGLTAQKIGELQASFATLLAQVPRDPVRDFGPDIAMNPPPGPQVPGIPGIQGQPGQRGRLGIRARPGKDGQRGQEGLASVGATNNSNSDIKNLARAMLLLTKENLQLKNKLEKNPFYNFMNY
jgi:chromosome segregation ATPase